MQRESIKRINKFLIRFTNEMTQLINKMNQNIDTMSKSLEKNEKTLQEIKENTIMKKQNDSQLDFITEIWDQSNTFNEEPQMINQTWFRRLLVSLGMRNSETLRKPNIIGVKLFSLFCFI